MSDRRNLKNILKEKTKHFECEKFLLAPKIYAGCEKNLCFDLSWG